MRTCLPALVGLGAAGWRPGVYDRWWQERGRGGLESIGSSLSKSSSIISRVKSHFLYDETDGIAFCACLFSKAGHREKRTPTTMDERVIEGVILHRECRPLPRTTHRFEIGICVRARLVDNREYSPFILGRVTVPLLLEA